MLHNIWDTCDKDYLVTEMLGYGSYGEVVKATHWESGMCVAIKLIKNVFKDSY